MTAVEKTEKKNQTALIYNLLMPRFLVKHLHVCSIVNTHCLGIPRILLWYYTFMTVFKCSVFFVFARVYNYIILAILLCNTFHIFSLLLLFVFFFFFWGVRTLDYFHKTLLKDMLLDSHKLDWQLIDFTGHSNANPMDNFFFFCLVVAKST